MASQAVVELAIIWPHLCGTLPDIHIKPKDMYKHDLVYRRHTLVSVSLHELKYTNAIDVAAHLDIYSQAMCLQYPRSFHKRHALHCRIVFESGMHS